MPTAALIADPIPTYTVCELNAAIGSLLERGFAPRFLVDASVLKPQVKKGHLWLTLTDGDASISAVVWSSRLKQLSYRPDDGDGVLVVGKLNFWAARANLTVQVLDIRPSLTTVLRQFEQVRALLTDEGIIRAERKRVLPSQPSVIAILTSVPSSALADMLRTAKERWPLTTLLVIPIPVQGSVAPTIRNVLSSLAAQHKSLQLDALVLARGGGSREDLAVFDDEDLCRDLACFPLPVVTGIGHEDDLTVADLVADMRAATPTAAIVALLPDRNEALQGLQQRRQRLHDHHHWWLNREQQRLKEKQRQLELMAPALMLQRHRNALTQKRQLLNALSPERWLKRGLAMVTAMDGSSLLRASEANPGERLNVQFQDGTLVTTVDRFVDAPSQPPS